MSITAALAAEQLEERADVLAAPAATDPQHALARGLDNHRGIAMALVDRELIERDDLEAVEVDGPQFAQQASAIDLLDRLPVEPEVPGHVAQRHDLAKSSHRLRQPARHARIGGEPGQPLQLRPAGRTLDPYP
jgi:hypothetical protein